MSKLGHPRGIGHLLVATTGKNTIVDIVVVIIVVIIVVTIVLTFFVIIVVIIVAFIVVIAVFTFRIVVIIVVIIVFTIRKTGLHHEQGGRELPTVGGELRLNIFELKFSTLSSTPL